MFAPCETASFFSVNTAQDTPELRQRRLELARRAFKDFFALCFWSCDPNYVIQEKDLPWVIRELRHNGGAKGYRAVAEICR